MTSRRDYLRGVVAGGLAISARGLLASQPAAMDGTAGGASDAPRWRNWSGIEQCQPQGWKVPADVGEVASLLRTSPGPIRCVGAGHSFSAVVPTGGTLLSLDRLSGLRSVTTNSAVLGAGTRLQQVSRLLDAKGLGLHNLPDIDSQTLAGAMATGTHGTGAQFGALHSDLLSLTLVTPTGRVVQCSRTQEPDIFAAAQVSVGTLGVVTEVEMRVRPRYHLARKVWLDTTEALLEQAPALAKKHRQFEMYLLPFTGFGAAITHDEAPLGTVNHPPAGDEDVLQDLKKLRDWLGRWPSLRRWAAQQAIDKNQVEEATDVSWRLLSTQRPTRFNETECHVPQQNGVACLKEVLAALEQRNDVFFPIEFRFTKGDDAWLSPFYQRDSCSIAAHALQGEPYDYLLSTLGPIYRRHGGRPHWGKLHDRSATELAAAYPRWKDFAQVRKALDPQGRMLTPYMAKILGETRNA